MADQTIHVQGLRDLQRAFALADKSVSKELRKSLRDAAEPVRSDAARLAVQEITRIGPRWSQMRVGVTRTLVYVAPKERGVKSRGLQQRKRKNLAPLLRDRALDPALDRNIGQVERKVEQMLATVGKQWERV
jgi:hypothetical protein